jgi:hypothetical protein
VDAVDEPIPYRYEIPFTADHRRRLGRAATAEVFRRPVVWVIGISLIVIGAGEIALGGGPWFLVAPIVFFALLALTYPLSLRRLAQAAPEGSVQRSGFGAGSYRIGLGAASATIPFTEVARIERRGDLVWVTLRPGRRRVVYGAALFPDAEIARVRAAASLS